MSSTKSSGVKTARWFVTLIENIDICARSLYLNSFLKNNFDILTSQTSVMCDTVVMYKSV